MLFEDLKKSKEKKPAENPCFSRIFGCFFVFENDETNGSLCNHKDYNKEQEKKFYKQLLLFFLYNTT